MNNAASLVADEKRIPLPPLGARVLQARPVQSDKPIALQWGLQEASIPLLLVFLLPPPARLNAIINEPCAFPARDARERLHFRRGQAFFCGGRALKLLGQRLRPRTCASLIISTCAGLSCMFFAERRHNPPLPSRRLRGAVTFR